MLSYGLGPPTPSPVGNGVFLARLHLSLPGEGVGGPKSYNSTESLVVYVIYSLFTWRNHFMLFCPEDQHFKEKVFVLCVLCTVLHFMAINVGTPDKKIRCFL
jgi:hypothetical protein